MTRRVLVSPKLPTLRSGNAEIDRWVEQYLQAHVSETFATLRYITQRASSFEATLTGMAASTVGTVEWQLNNNVATLLLPSALTGTSNATTMTMTGLPADVTPSANRTLPVFYGVDNGASAFVSGTVANTGVISFFIASSGGAAAFTNTGTKGLGAGWSISYPL